MSLVLLAWFSALATGPRMPSRPQIIRDVRLFDGGICWSIAARGHGASVHGELALFVREGLTPVEALAAATSAPAKCFHLSDRGAIRPGLRADLVCQKAIRRRISLPRANIVAVWKRRILVQRASRRRGVVLWAVM
jgi:adenine deaminase